MRAMNPDGYFKTFTENVVLSYPVWEDGGRAKPLLKSK